MTKEQILSCLCVYDERNPYYLPFDEDDLSRKPTDCGCDNCFYNRNKMAEFILSQLPQQEISDEEIEKAGERLVDDEYEFNAFIIGAKWYREKIKQKQ